ncbi:MAG: conjugative transposon protein TraM, partial [Chitinophagaceae bacterium]|nr:conjugative transposon protein TraM [Chitinophagaceae bacterium]
KALVQTKTGLNTQLPDANLKNQSSLDKLSFYAMADRDSLKRDEQKRMDPNYQSVIPEKTIQQSTFSDESGELISHKITRLQRQIDEQNYSIPPEKKYTSESSSDIDRLQMMMQSINQKKVDPEMDALNGTLDKLLEIQNPSRVKREIVSDKNGKVFAVTSNGLNSDKNYFGNASRSHSNTFLSEMDELKDSLKAGVIIAVVHNEQTLSVGSVIKLRLLQDVFVNGERIPRGSFLFGYSSIDNERLKVVVSSIQFQNRLFPVALTVFDMDGLEGINIPGSIGRDVMKQSVDQSIQSVGGMSFDPSLKAQAATAGVNVTKSLLSKNVKQVRVTVKAGYRVLLKDENDKSN